MGRKRIRKNNSKSYGEKKQCIEETSRRNSIEEELYIRGALGEDEIYGDMKKRNSKRKDNEERQ